MAGMAREVVMIVGRSEWKQANTESTAQQEIDDLVREMISSWVRNSISLWVKGGFLFLSDIRKLQSGTLGY